MSNTNVVEFPNKRVTKVSQAKAIYAEMVNTKRGKPRKNPPAPAEVKAEFVSKVGMTVRQAATYYHMIASGKWAS